MFGLMLNLRRAGLKRCDFRAHAAQFAPCRHSRVRSRGVQRQAPGRCNATSYSGCSQAGI